MKMFPTVKLISNCWGFHQQLSVAILLLAITSCHKDQTSDLPTSKGVYIVNEGLFQSGIGEVSFYDPDTKQITNDLFSNVNNYSLGNVAQSMYIKDSIGF